MAVGALPGSWNWYDYVVAIAVASGVYTGLRTGLLRSVWRAVTWALMTGVGLLLYPSAGPWVRDIFNVGTDAANLQAFLLVGIAVYILCRLGDREITIRLAQRPLPALADNLGGAVVGPLVMAFIVVWASFVLVLMRSRFWHEQVAERSYIGARLVRPFPALATAPKKSVFEQPWFLQPVPRRAEPTPERDGSR